MMISYAGELRSHSLLPPPWAPLPLAETWAPAWLSPVNTLCKLFSRRSLNWRLVEACRAGVLGIDATDAV